jgi:hypothetical protein
VALQAAADIKHSKKGSLGICPFLGAISQIFCENVTLRDNDMKKGY